MQIPNFSQAKVLIYGDVMLDRYWHGSTSRISPEAPVPVVHIGDTEDRPGGAGNVALNINALGANAELFGLVGNDENATILCQKLEKAGIKPSFQHMDNWPTVTKLRVLSLHQQLIRLDFEQNFREVDTKPLMASCIQQLATAGALILSDYGKGCLNDIPTLIKAARAAQVPVLVDPKSTDFGDYHGASLITPNFKEFEATVGPCPDDETMITKGRAVMHAHDIEALLITRGEKGMTLLKNNGEVVNMPARAKEVFDVTGAGDTVIGTVAAALAAGEEIETAMVLANAAAGIVVGKVGTAVATVPELTAALGQLKGSSSGAMLSETGLMALVADAKQHGRRIVMTNGCFDILHSGHITYLEEAKALGDLLIVAVNDDASVERLKGSDRPYNNLQQRMAVLAGLAAVDWVVPFSEDTPERVICKVLPDILVKGGDYAVEDIAGHKCVLANGGQVRILSFVDGFSTTNLINKIREEVAEV